MTANKQTRETDATGSLIYANDRRGLRSVIDHFRERSRCARIELFRRHILIDAKTRLLDLGGWDGSHVNTLITGTQIDRHNVFVADINATAVEAARERYGFTPVLMNENDHRLPYSDGFFDIVFCSSVIEHVTGAKNEVWEISNGQEFRARAIKHQMQIAREIRRLGKQYYVQVPYHRFPLETHTWLPFVAQLPRSLQLKTIRLSNRYWIKHTSPDFYLPTKYEMQEYFPDATLMWETVFGLKKSLIAIKTKAC